MDVDTPELRRWLCLENNRGTMMAEVAAKIILLYVST
jgi:hypothetical protein